jgi:8-oxo-dGTP pyrophosphatase MutT (NUDIX family)
VDAADADDSLIARSAITPGEAAAALGGDLAPEVALATHLAALRELFEEAGVLLADTHAAGDRVEAARSALLGGTASFAAVAEDLDLRLRTDLLVSLSRWVTPPTLPRRFDARFFAAALPEGLGRHSGRRVAHVWFHRPTRSRRWPRPPRDVAADERALQQLEHARSIEEIRWLAPGCSGRRIGGVWR